MYKTKGYVPIVLNAKLSVPWRVVSDIASKWDVAKHKFLSYYLWNNNRDPYVIHKDRNAFLNNLREYEEAEKYCCRLISANIERPDWEVVKTLLFTIENLQTGPRRSRTVLPLEDFERQTQDKWDAWWDSQPPRAPKRQVCCSPDPESPTPITKSGAIKAAYYHKMSDGTRVNPAVRMPRILEEAYTRHSARDII